MGIFIMKQIELKGKNGIGIFVKVDDADFEYLNKFKWYLKKGDNTNYARRNLTQINGRTLQILMHREILGLSDPKILGEHEDQDGLNNQRQNLRPCNTRENARNKRAKKNSTSKYLGVGTQNAKGNNKIYQYWTAHIKYDGKDHHIGSFPYTPEGEIMAAKRYDEKAKEHFKEFANLNFK